LSNYNIPVEFEQVPLNVLDDRFMKVKVWLAHTGENRNNSIFSKELLESMIPSLANIPILGYIAVDDNGKEIDFMGHEERLVIEDNEFKLKYVGRAYGLIPTENNARFEKRYGEDGLEREYLVCDGLIWRKFPEVERIFDRDGGFKSQSMELQYSSVKGYTDSNGVFVFTEAKFEGACLLGENVSPAMISSTIEKFSVANKIQTELSEMLTEFNTCFSTTLQKGDNDLEDNKVLDPQNPETDFAKKDKEKEDKEKEKAKAGEGTPAKKEDPKAGEGDSKEKTPAKEEPKKGEEPAKSEPSKEADPAKGEPKEAPKKEGEPQPKKDEEDDEEKKKKSPKKFSRTFELSHDDIRVGLYHALDSHDNFKDSFMYVSQVYDNHAIVVDENEGKFFKVNYVKHESGVSLGDQEELFPMFVNASEKSAIDTSRNNFSALETEVKELREFKSEIELKEKEAKLSTYSSSLKAEDYKTIKDNLKNFSMDDMEKEIAVTLLRNNHFSATKTEEEPSSTRVVSTGATTDSNPYGSASIYFTK